MFSARCFHASEPSRMLRTWWPPRRRISTTESASSYLSSTSSPRAGFAGSMGTAAGFDSSTVGQMGRNTWNALPAPRVDSTSKRQVAPPLERLAALSEAEFQELFGDTPVWRARYSGFLRNVAVAMGNRALPQFRPALERLAASEDAMVAEHARWALGKLVEDSTPSPTPRAR